MRVKTEAKRESIIEIASQVFSEAGFEGASMAEIAARVGGSKSTLYGYFSSKEELFLEVAIGAAKEHIELFFLALEQDESELQAALKTFAEKMLAVICSEPALQAKRAFVAESGRSDIGKRFFELGPQKGIQALGSFLEAQMRKGLIRQADPLTAARHFMALMEAETATPRLFGLEENLSKPKLRQAIGRAVDVFLRGYAADPTPRR